MGREEERRGGVNGREKEERTGGKQIGWGKRGEEGKGKGEER